jgi:hypothetical protein
MSEPEDQPNQQAVCRAPSRRRTATKRASARSRQPRSRDTCPERQRLLDPDHEAFVEWFVTYWRGNGAQLFAGQTTSKEASR